MRTMTAMIHRRVIFTLMLAFGLLSILAAAPPTHVMEPLPGRREGRQRNRPPALEVVRRLPSGAVRPQMLQEST